MIEDYANAPVPHSRTVNGWRVAMIVTGFNIALPGLPERCADRDGARSFTGGAGRARWPASCSVRWGASPRSVSVRTRLTTYVLVQRSFGRSGAALVNIIMALVHFGWFGVNASFFGDAMVAATQELFGVTAPFSPLSCWSAAC